MRLPTITPGFIQLKPIIICVLCALFIIFLSISSISVQSNGLRLRRSARKLLGLNRHTPKVCDQLVRRESINWNYFYYYKNPASQQEIIWCKVPKAGSTTLTKLFLRLAGLKSYNNNNTRVHKLLRNFYPRLPNQVMWEKMKVSKTFMVVRDPFERILSAYRDKLENYQRDLVYRDGYYHEHYGKFMVKPDIPRVKKGVHLNGTKTNGNSTSVVKMKSGSARVHINATTSLRKEPTWREFVQYLLKTSVARYDEHWMPITKLCSPCSVQYDYVIRMEHFDSEIQHPLKDAGITAVDLGRNHMTGTANMKLVEKYFKNLTMNEVKKLYTKYKRDFLLFGYTPFKYFRFVSKKGEGKKNRMANSTA